MTASLLTLVALFEIICMNAPRPNKTRLAEGLALIVT